MQNIRKKLLTILIILLLIASLGGVLAMGINAFIQTVTKNDIVFSCGSDLSITEEQKNRLAELDADCILVLGCGIRADGSPSPMLRDRLDTGILLYKSGIAPKLLLSGDNGSVSHNEIRAMLAYAREKGVPDEDIFCDHAGFSTYDSMYRAGLIFQVKKAVIVTQTYHMYRSLYIADKLGLTALGAGADQYRYGGQAAREVREVLARDKDFFKCILKPDPTYGGDVIPITGDGTVSHGE